MKAIYKSAGLLVAFAALLSGCQAEMNEPALTAPVASLQANTTIAELKNTFYQAASNYATLVGAKDEASGEHYIVKGRVCSSDASGNIYQTIYIQDETAALPISCRINSYYNRYRLGQEVVLDVTGLYFGKYAGLMQLGDYSTYNGTPQVSFMPEEQFKAHVQLNGLPDDNTAYVDFGSPYPADQLYAVTFNGLDNFPAATDANAKLYGGQLVEIRNVSFIEQGVPFSEYQSTLNRNITSGGSTSLIIRSSGYSNFYTDLTPSGVGTVRGILGYYNGTWQLTLRSRYDVLFGADAGTKESPYSVADALAAVNQGSTGWVKGYIVGAVKIGTTTISSNSDIEWGATSDADDTVVIADDLNCRDYKQCIVVSLPAGSALRSRVNLLDNPANAGKLLNVCGTLQTRYGVTTLGDSVGTDADFELTEGGEISGGGDTPGTTDPTLGTEANPYTALDLLAMPVGTKKSDVWVEGYIVGFMSENTATMNQPVFSAAGATDATIILGTTAATASLDAAVPAKLKRSTDARADLGLKANPTALGKHVKVFGNIASGFSVAGAERVCLENVSAYKAL